ncbi:MULTISPECIES: benzoate/H(+) symporter BenE family transporter [Giesbergeria]|uniref:Benzoate/H(+) symporter BenE family transporter n=1 Tax=Giesbergeria sinuosa TaxID=80883 RepID=A0ABV9QFD8_9BURK
MSLRQDFSLSALTAGLLAVIISYAGPLVIFFQAGQSAQVSPEMMSSWVWAISFGAGLSGLLLSWWLKVPVVTAWSAPGTALLVTLFPAITLEQAVGAYLLSGLVMLLMGLSGYFDKLIQSIPKGIASGMMAGILFQFGVGAFQAAKTAPVLALSMIGIYLLFRRLLPRYCLVILLLAGLGLAVLLEGVSLSGVPWALAQPTFITPEWTWEATLSLAVPLVLVSVTGQYLPGMAILRSAGYSTAARPIIVSTSMASLVVACFGGINIVIAAITAALCTGKDAHEQANQRYIAGMANGLFYLIGGSFASSIIWLFAALPQTLIAVLAGLALMGAIAGSLVNAINEVDHREASIITFLATASGMTLWGLGSAFWGVLIGGVAYVLLHQPWQQKPAR